jgi:hypothetical protein
MLPTAYFHATIPVPDELRQQLRANQRDGDGALLKAAATAIVELARDRRFVVRPSAHGLDRWGHGRRARRPPHLDTAAVLSSARPLPSDRRRHLPRWPLLVSCPSGLPGSTQGLGQAVRGKLKALLGRRRPDLVLPASVWRKPWIVHITAWRAGKQAVLDYLARYVFRLAITNTRLVGLNDHAVTVRHTHCKSARWRT